MVLLKSLAENTWADTGARSAFWVLSLPVVALTGLSWARLYAASSLSTNHGSHDTVPGAILGAGIIATLVAAGILAARASRRAGTGPVDRAFMNTLTIASLLLVVMAAPMLPLLSNDVFSLLAYADLAFNHGGNPFVPRNGFISVSAFAPLVNPTWSNAPCVYGPVALAWVAPAIALGRGDPAWTLMWVKVLAALTAAILVLLLRAVALGLHGPVRRNHVLMAMAAPLLWIEGAGQAHTDLLLATLLAGWILAASRDRVLLASALLGTAAATKMTALIPAGLYLVWLVASSVKDTPKCFLRVLMAAVLMMAVVVLGYLPFGSLPDSLAVPLAWLGHRPPTNTIYEGIWWGSVLLGWNAEDMKMALYWITQTQFVAVSGISIVLVFRSVDFRRMIGVTAMTGLLLSTFFSPIQHAWYLLPFLPMVLAVCDDRWHKWLLWMTLAAAACGVSDLFEAQGTVPLVFRAATIVSACVGSVAWLVHRMRTWLKPEAMATR